MNRLLLVFTASLLAGFPAAAFQEEVQAAPQRDAVSAEDGGKPAPTTRTAAGERIAISREAHPRTEARPDRAPTPAAVPARARTTAVERSARPQPVAAQDQRRNDGTRERGDNPPVGGAVQRGERPRGDNPPIGRAVPRESRPGVRPAPNRGGNIYVAPPAYSYYYSPRRYYPYGYGAFGLGYFYYDPYTWYPPSYYSGAYYDPYVYNSFDIGELRLAVSPRTGDVYVDGYFAGRVDDYDGVFQALKVESGAHHIQIVAPGYAPLDFDIRINPGQKITYRGALQPSRP